MIKCSVPVDTQIIVCMPEPNPNLPVTYTSTVPENTSIKSLTMSTAVYADNELNMGTKNVSGVCPWTSTPNMTKSFTVVRLQQSDYACPPNWHHMDNMCFTLPHLMYNNNVEFENKELFVTCKGEFEYDTKRGNLPCSCPEAKRHFYDTTDRPKDIEEKDSVLIRYLKLLRETYRMGLVIHTIDYYDEYIDKLVRLIPTKHGTKIQTCFSLDQDDQELCSMTISTQAMSCPHGFFVCKDHTCIVETSRCDGQQDCVGGDDEIGCPDICSDPHPTEGCTHCTIAESCQCNALYFQCLTGGCVPATLVCDGVVSCSDGSDEALCKPEPHPLTCEVDLKSCPISTQINIFQHRCVYSQGDIHTSDGSHLVHCKGWQCSSMYKCEATYCVPIHHICNRICDCPSCDDEYGCIEDVHNVMLSCPGMVKCKRGYPCVHNYNVHAGEHQCMDTHDDEFVSPVCPVTCSCHGTSIYCASFVTVPVQDFTAISASNNDFASLQSLEQQWARCVGMCHSLVFLDISDITDWDIAIMHSIPHKLNEIHVLKVSSNGINTLMYSTFGTLRNIIHLYMQHCSIYEIGTGVFIATSLHIIDLSYNKLNIIAERCFGIMHNLMHFILSNNKIQGIQLNVFQSALKLISLDLRNNEILSVSLDPTLWVSTLNLTILRSDEQVLCCIIPTSKLCYPLEDAFQSCSCLLQQPHNKYILGLLAAVIISLNAGVLLYVVFWKSHHRLAKKRQIWSSGLSAFTDAFLGVYIAGIVAADITYGSTFGKYRELWKINKICMLLESTLMYFITSSSLLILHMCGVLLFSVVNILKVSNKHYNLSLAAVMIICIIISFLKRLVSVTSNGIKANTFCIPFITRVVASTLDFQMGFEWSLLIIHVIFIISIIISLAAIIWVIYRRQRTLKQNRQTNRKNTCIKLALYIIIVAITKTLSLVTWFCVLVGVQIVPDVLHLVILITLSIWPIFHRFMHTIVQRKH